MDEKLSNLWNLTLGEIKKNLSKPSYETWLKTTRPIAIHESTLLIEVPNIFTKDWLKNQYKDQVSQALSRVTDQNLSVKFVSSQGMENHIHNNTKKTAHQSEVKVNKQKHFLNEKPGWLNPKYNFESFVVGNGNRLAHAASLAVAEAPSKAYNPLFIYGGVGLGKTHLMHAIGHYILLHNHNKKVVYLSSETFTNSFINSIRDNKTVEFRNKYRNNDILLIDDIQFLAGKEQTQEEFFHTFNALHENHKQIIISSDRPPKEIPTLEDRLRSRFEWGLITDINPPDLETRIAILHKKSFHEEIKIPDDVILFIAQRVEKNIRELEGALIRVIAYSSLSNQTVNLSLAEEALKDFFSKNKQKTITPSLIKKNTANYFKVKEEDLSSKRRSKEIAYPRQIAMYLCRELTDYSFPKIGEEFGGKDHTTVLHACKKISHDLQHNNEIKKDIKNIKEAINKT